MKIFICGFTGAGKSFLLSELKMCKSLKGFKFLDLDQYILSKLSGYKTLSDYIYKAGFPEFRLMEESSIKELARMENIIVALGGGSLSAETAELLSSWKGYWLNESFEVCYERIKNDKNRPIADLGKEGLQKLYDERRQWYSNYEEYREVNQVIDFTKNNFEKIT